MWFQHHKVLKIIIHTNAVTVTSQRHFSDHRPNTASYVWSSPIRSHTFYINIYVTVIESVPHARSWVILEKKSLELGYVTCQEEENSMCMLHHQFCSGEISSCQIWNLQKQLKFGIWNVALVQLSCPDKSWNYSGTRTVLENCKDSKRWYTILRSLLLSKKPLWRDSFLN